MKNSDARQQSPTRENTGAARRLAVPPHPPVPTTAAGEAAAAVGEPLPDLRQEAANMLRLALAQEEVGTPLGISSRQARVVLGQF